MNHDRRLPTTTLRTPHRSSSTRLMTTMTMTTTPPRRPRAGSKLVPSFMPTPTRYYSGTTTPMTNRSSRSKRYHPRIMHPYTVAAAPTRRSLASPTSSPSIVARTTTSTTAAVTPSTPTRSTSTSTSIYQTPTTTRSRSRPTPLSHGRTSSAKRLLSSLDSAACVEADDRFIPSRRRLNMELCRRALLTTSTDQDESDSQQSSSPTQPPPPPPISQETPLQQEYKRRLLSALCNVPLHQLTKAGHPVGLLPIGSGQQQAPGGGRRFGMNRLWAAASGGENMAPPATTTTSPALINPFCHDTLRQLKLGRTVTTVQGWTDDDARVDDDVGGQWMAGGAHRGGKGVWRKVPTSPLRILDAPDIVDDYYLNLISWSQDNILAVALAQSVYLWNATTGDIQHLITVDHSNDYITSVCWCPTPTYTHCIAVGTNLAQVHLYNGHTLQKIQTIPSSLHPADSSMSNTTHSGRVSALAWNPSQAQWMTSGARDSRIVQHDLRQARSTTTSVYRGHEQEVCGLKWNEEGTCLASGGNENYLCLWDAHRSNTTTTNSGTTTQQRIASRLQQHQNHAPRLILRQHKAAVKALDWCPFHRGLLASGGGTADRTLKFWNSTSGAVLHSVDTGSQVCSVVWSPLSGARELCTSHGYSENQLILWNYSTMTKIQELKGHSARVLNMEKSPDGTAVVSAAADETLRFWNVFSTPHESSGGMMAAAGRGGVLSSLGGPTIR